VGGTARSIGGLGASTDGGAGSNRDLIDAAFRVFDKDGDGFLNAFDLRSVFCHSVQC